MDILFICRDALASSVVTNLALAQEAKKAGREVAVLFTEEALQAAAETVFRWPQELAPQEMREKLADNAGKVGIPTFGGKSQARRIDAQAAIKEAKKNGITMFASPLWVTLLGIDGKLPEELTGLSQADELKMLKEAKTIIGSY